MMHAQELARALEGLAEPRILIVGDVMLDRYVTGDVSRISPEAPIPIIAARHSEEKLGGAGNVVANLRSMGARRGQIWRRVRFPAALPSFFSGLRLSVTYSVVAATIGEWVGGSAGLGLYMLRSKNALQTDQVFLAMLITTSMSIVLFGIVAIVERLLIPWNRADEHEQWMESGIY